MSLFQVVVLLLLLDVAVLNPPRGRFIQGVNMI